LGQEDYGYKPTGGKCKKCGNDDVFVLEFHHIDPNKKDKEIQDIRGKQWSSIKTEIEKCELLCRNCHSETHHPNSNKKTKHLGNYHSEVEAAREVDKEYVRNYRNFKRTNFRYSTEDMSKMLN